MSRPRHRKLHSSTKPVVSVEKAECLITTGLNSEYFNDAITRIRLSRPVEELLKPAALNLRCYWRPCRDENGLRTTGVGEACACGGVVTRLLTDGQNSRRHAAARADERRGGRPRLTRVGVEISFSRLHVFWRQRHGDRRVLSATLELARGPLRSEDQGGGRNQRGDTCNDEARGRVVSTRSIAEDDRACRDLRQSRPAGTLCRR